MSGRGEQDSLERARRRRGSPSKGERAVVVVGESAEIRQRTVGRAALRDGDGDVLRGGDAVADRHAIEWISGLVVVDRGGRRASDGERLIDGDIGARLGRTKRGRAAIARSVGRAAGAAAGLIPGAERDARRNSSIEIGVRQEAHKSVGIGRQQPRARICRTAEVGPIAAAVGRILPGAVRIVYGSDGNSGECARIGIGHFAGNQRGDLRARIARGRLILVDRG